MTRDGESTRFTERARARREREVVDTCLAAFADQGCFRLTLDQVAASVGIAKGTIYLHYPSREALFGAAVDRGFQQLYETCWRVWEAAATPAAGLRAVLRELVVRSYRDDPVSPRMLGRLRCAVTSMQRAPAGNGHVERALVPLAEAWQAAGLVDPSADPAWVVRVMLALSAAEAIGEPTDRSSAAAPAAPAPDSPDEAAERIATLIVRGFGPVDHTVSRQTLDAPPSASPAPSA